ncbi:HlyC/CorC family transporter [Methanococcoides sp. SA1]|nr:HlyC/CorC family transporter [Methanococcoides sp. SA1]
MSLAIGILIILCCVIMEAFFSGSEIALVSLDRLRLKEDARNGKHSAKLILRLLENPERLLGTTLLGTNIATITSTTVSAGLFYTLLGAPGIPLSVVVITSVNWIFAEIVPKSVFQQLSDEITAKTIYILLIFYVIFYPVVFIFSTISKAMTTLVSGGAKNAAENSFVSKKELQQIMNMRYDHSDVKPGEQTMISKVLDFNEVTAKEVMVPLINVAGVDSKATVAQTANIVKMNKHRRLPVYAKRIDKIIGIINTFDILDVDNNNKITPFIRDTLFIPPSMNASDLLEELQKSRKNMAIVVDEYGGAEGIVTIEDILEEVVGEIEDEYDGFSDQRYYEKSDEVFVKANMEINEFNEQTGINLPEGDYITIGGFFLENYGRIPKKGESMIFGNKKFVVLKANERTILEIKIVDDPES